MKVGIALPNAVPGASGAEMVEWARRADARGYYAFLGEGGADFIASYAAKDSDTVKRHLAAGL